MTRRDIEVEELLQRYAAGERNFANIRLYDIDDRLCGCNLSGINLSGSKISAYLADVDLSGADLSNNIIGGSLWKTNLTRANLEGVEFKGVRFHETIMPDGSIWNEDRGSNCIYR
ncbi:low-complexity protein [Brunnivagina elsteri CCALA 953]|uniref:Low-complexity protein n=1 Tax=Brunnivagina elsteri CCALA 953 TaxID=987040 RepID=A0A2A2TFB8_9CYAN|nr:pentapeptide repeat-containing protein [Calothrix elsteri]PAX52335.1 low-complexity protein [Calothrix elsteri CCALA 953]